MSGDNSDAAVLAALDRWYSRRVNERYGSDFATRIYRGAFAQEKRMGPDAGEHFKGDFVWTFPTRAWPPRNGHGFFSCRYARLDGYIRNAGDGLGNAETREMETMAPAYAVRKACNDLIAVVDDLAEGRELASLDDAFFENAFGYVFSTPAAFAVFSLGYLHTRLLNASIKTSCAKMSGPDYKVRVDSFQEVCHFVEEFSDIVFGDKVH